MKKARWTFVGLFILALATVYESLKLPIWDEGYPMSGFFPVILGILLAILSVLYLLRFGLEKKINGSEDHLTCYQEEERETDLEGRINWKKVLLSMGAIAAYPFVFMTLGYVVGTTIFLLFMCRFVERMKLPVTLIVTSVVITVSYTVFGLLLKVPLH